MKNKAVSTVVVTVLLILIGFLAVGLIWGFVLPLVKEGLGKGKSCFDLRDYLTILESKYTCYTSSSTSLMIDRDLGNYSIKGFIVSVISEGSSTRYQVEPGGVTGVSMRDKTTNEVQDNIELPLPGEARTYIFETGSSGSVEIAVLQENGKACTADFYNIPDCEDIIE